MTKSLSHPEYSIFLAAVKDRILHARMSAVRAINDEKLSQAVRELVASFKGRLPSAKQLADAVREVLPSRK